jgi:hypothetical protein
MTRDAVVDRTLRYLSFTGVLLAAILAGACDFWPRDLEPLAQSISKQVSGNATAWLVAGDVVVIDVAGSPFYRHDQQELETLATDIAEQTVAFVSAPLESIVVTFHEGEITEIAEQQRQFIFLVTESRPVLQPFIDEDATGPLTDDELEAAVDRLGETVTREQRVCVQGEVKQRAKAAGDPETLDPANVEFFTAGTWDDLDAFAKRLFLAQAITSQALFACASTRKP